MSKQVLSTIIVITLAVAGGAFYGGMKYQESKTPAAGNSQNFRNLSFEQRQQMFGQSGANAPSGTTGRTSGNQVGANLAKGEIIAKDDKSITIKLQNNGSKIIFFSDSTKITKSTEGSSSDFEIGKMATVSGKQNSDGSLTAETVQLNPSRPVPSESPKSNP